MRFGALGANKALMAAIMVVGRDFLLRMAAALLEEAQLAADPQEAVTQHADDIITLAADLTAPDHLDSTPL